MSNQIMVKMVIDAWSGRLKDVDTLLDKVSDEQLQNDIAPGRNSGTYLLGHLIAVHDRMLPLLGLGELNYPQLADVYINNPDKAKPQTISATELRQYWKNINSTLANHFNNMQTDDWFQKHNSVSVEDFAKEPHRNKLNIILSRTTHLTYHTGQLALLKK